MSEALKKVVVIGAGSIGQRHLRCFHRTGQCDVAFVEINDALRNNLLQEHPYARAFSSLDQALAERFDAAVIATPAPLHIQQARTFVERDIPVLIEKPLAVTMEGVASFLELVHSKHVTVGVAYVYRAHPVLAEMRNAIQTGRFGRPLELIAVSGQHFPFYRPAYRETYYTQHATGGGAIQDALTHILNAGAWLVGPVERVVADAAHCLLPGVTVEDTVHVLARHTGSVIADEAPSQVLASYTLNQHQAPNETSITVVCERGTVRFEMHACRWRECSLYGGPWIDHERVPLERDELFILQAQGFLSAIAGQSDPACSLEEGLGTLQVNQAILRSVESERWESACQPIPPGNHPAVTA